MIIKVNFGNENSVLPSDEFILDFGSGYSSEQGFGWVTEASLNGAETVPIDILTNTRDRDFIEDQSTDTLIHLQYPTGLPGARAAASIKTPSAWEYDLEDGTYRITVSVGDPEFVDSNHVINLEGETVISSFSPTEDDLFTEATAVVEVTDGRLTLDANGGFNTKVNFIEIEAVDGDDIEDSTDVEEVVPLDPEEGGETPTDSTEDSAGDDSTEPTDSEDSGETPTDSTEEGTGDDSTEPTDSEDSGETPTDSTEDGAGDDSTQPTDSEDGRESPTDSTEEGAGDDTDDSGESSTDSTEDGCRR